MKLHNILEVHHDAMLVELSLSHRDLENLLRAELKAQHPENGTYVWPRDVYEDVVVYSIETNGSETLLQRSYAIADNVVTFGDPVEVVASTQYVPVSEADDLEERKFTQEQRDAFAAKGWAMPDGGYPIENASDLRNAIQSYGRGGAKRNVQKHIIKRAKALGREDLIPEDWRESAVEFETDLVPLVEKAVKKDGTIAIKVIAPGQGSSGYYSPEVLKRDGPNVFKKGLHIYADHPSLTEESDRPERSIKDLLGALSTDATWQDEGAAGPGLYAEAQLRSDVAPLIEDLAPHIGMSIRALGKAEMGEVDGKTTRVITAIEQARSCDVVTVPGAGGRVLELMEAARQGMTPLPKTRETEENASMEKELQEAQTKLAEAQKEIDDFKDWKAQIEAREAEAALLAETRSVVTATLAEITMPDQTRARLTEHLSRNAPMKDNALDKDALIATVKEAAERELAYIASVSGNGKITGMGESSAADDLPKLEEIDKRLEEAINAF